MGRMDLVIGPGDGGIKGFGSHTRPQVNIIFLWWSSRVNLVVINLKRSKQFGSEIRYHSLRNSDVVTLKFILTMTEQKTMV